MESVKIFFGSDSRFNEKTKDLKSFHTLSDLFNHINKTEIDINGVDSVEKEPLNIENLVVNTDDYGSIKEWALLGFSNNILQNKKLNICNLWINNPPTKIHDDVVKMYPKIIEKYTPQYRSITIDTLKNMVNNYEDVVIGQNSVIKQIVSSLYLLKNDNRKKPVSILFLGESGVGKTETAKFISENIDKAMVRIQFSMQQTNDASKFIFGADHGEDSLARELIRRNSNVVLLDEFDKVHPLFYNAFYQMFDEGVFVDSNYNVNMEKCVIICTSNYTNERDAEKHLGMPIYSRFSKIIKFDNLNSVDIIKIASKIYEKLFQQIDEHDSKIIADNDILNFYIDAIKKGSYRNIRMLKNDMEEAINYEILKKLNVID